MLSGLIADLPNQALFMIVVLHDFPLILALGQLHFMIYL
jgi:hypothetical protein